MKHTQSKVGWVGKEENGCDLCVMSFDWSGLLRFGRCFIERNKGRKATWADEDWPPRKVRVTVTVEDV